MAVDKHKLEKEACVLRFYKIVLSWDYNRILDEAEKRQRQPRRAQGLKEVKSTYADVDEYLGTFEPLLFEEVKANIAQKKDEDEERVCQEAVIAECREVNEFHLPMVICSDPEKVSENDLLLVSNKKFEGKIPNAYAFALVEHRQQDKLRLRLYLGGEVKRYNTDEIQSRPRLLNMLPVVCEVKKMFFIEKICSLSTIVREYVALQSISYLPFKDLILNAAEIDNITEDRAWKLSKPLKEFIESNHNKSQLAAIYAGLSRKSFVLIQVEQKLAGVDTQVGDKQKQGGTAKDKDSIRASILDEAVIVFSTLSYSGSTLFSKLSRSFDVVIIDEAAQADARTTTSTAVSTTPEYNSSSVKKARLESTLAALLTDPVLADVPKKPFLSDVDTLINLELGSAMRLTVLKLDGTSFDVALMNTATLKDLKLAVKKKVNEMEESNMGHRQISWRHVWARVDGWQREEGLKLEAKVADCLCHRDYEVNEHEELEEDEEVQSTDDEVTKSGPPAQGRQKHRREPPSTNQYLELPPPPARYTWPTKDRTPTRDEEPRGSHQQSEDAVEMWKMQSRAVGHSSL